MKMTFLYGKYAFDFNIVNEKKKKKIKCLKSHLVLLKAIRANTKSRVMAVTVLITEEQKKQVNLDTLLYLWVNFHKINVHLH